MLNSVEYIIKERRKNTTKAKIGYFINALVSSGIREYHGMVALCEHLNIDPRVLEKYIGHRLFKNEKRRSLILTDEDIEVIKLSLSIKEKFLGMSHGSKKIFLLSLLSNYKESKDSMRNQ